MRITRKRASEIIGPGAATSNQPLFGAFRRICESECDPNERSEAGLSTELPHAAPHYVFGAHHPTGTRVARSWARPPGLYWQLVTAATIIARDAGGCG